MCPAHRHWLKQPAPQRVGAFAAIARDDRTAVSERVPHRLPGGRGNRGFGEAQTPGVGSHTSRIGGSELPPRTAAEPLVTLFRRRSLHTLGGVVAELLPPVAVVRRRRLTPLNQNKSMLTTPIGVQHARRTTVGVADSIAGDFLANYSRPEDPGR